VVVVAATVAYAVVAAYFSLRKHEAFLSGVDLASLDQPLWLLAQGEEPVVQHGRSFWGDHFGLTFLALVPLYAIGFGAGGLLLLQAIAMAAVAPILFLLARAYGADGWLAALPALIWLASPLTLIPNVQDVHAVPLVAPVIAASVLALKHDRFVLFGVAAVIACCAREDVALIYVMLGVVVALEGRRRLGAAIGAAAVGVFVFATLIFMPSFSSSTDWFVARFAGERGESLGDVVRWTATNPVAALGDLFAPENLLICAALIVTTGGLCLLAPRWMLLGVPALAHNLLSAYEPQHQLRDHYYVPVALSFAIAGAVGAGRLATLGRRARLLAAGGATFALLSVSFGLVWAKGVSEWSSSESDAFGGAAARRELLELIPDDEPAAASSHLTPHLTHRPELYTLPLPFLGREEFGTDWSERELARRADRVRWVALDTIDRPYELDDTPERLSELLPRLGFRELARRGSVAIYVRTSPSS
jgi:uncharacterized membrane protein